MRMPILLSPVSRQHAIDGVANTGWAIHGTGQWNVDRKLTARFEKPLVLEGEQTLTVRLDQNYGSITC